MAFFGRPILLYNEFIPAITGKRTWEYQAFGHYDGIDVKESISLQNAGNFEELFRMCTDYEMEMRPFFSQILFGLYENKESEKAFWEGASPVLYLTLLQFKGKNIAEYYNYLMSGQYVFQKAEQLGLEGKAESIRVQVYYSLDNSELLLAVKCQYPSTGAAMINDLHLNLEGRHPFQIRNSYSIFAIRSTDIQEPQKHHGFSEKADMVELRVVEKENNSVGRLYERVKEQLEAKKNGIDVERRLLLGTEDESIIIKNIPWRMLLPLYQRNTGILCNSNGAAQEYAYAISAKIMFSFEKREINQQKPKKKSGGEGELSKKSVCEVLAKKIDEMYKERKGTRSYGEKKNLMMFVSALQRFEIVGYSENPFTDYNIYTIFLPFYMFLNLQEEYGDRHRAYYYEFMKSMKLRTQNFAKSDRVFSQIADFNMRYCDIPAKFVTIYSAYIYYMKKALNTETDKSYEFLICTGENSRTEVRELFQQVSERDRLFLVEIPENQIYAPKLMFIMLGHEIAHFVGREIRQREKREKSMIDICARIILFSVQNYLNYLNECNVSKTMKEEWEYLEENLSGWIQVYMDRNNDVNYLEEYYYQDFSTEEISENIKFNSEHGWHTDVLKRTLTVAIRDVLLNRGEQIFSFALTGEYNQKKIEEQDYNRFFKEKETELNECIQAFLAPKQIRKSALTLEAALDKVIYLVKECYADVVCILTLHLSMEDYFLAFTQNLNMAGTPVEEVEDTILIARTAIVMSVLSYKEKTDGKKKSTVDEQLWRWTDEEFTKQSNTNAEVLKLENAASEFTYRYIKEPTEIESEQRMLNAVDIIYDQKILRKIIGYLLTCREKFCAETKRQQQLQGMKQAKRFFEMTQIEKTDCLFREMTKLLTEYETDVWTEIAELK